MPCLGVLFAVDKKTVNKLKRVKWDEFPDYISDDLEEEWFEKNPDLTQELDKSWDAMHRMFYGGKLVYGMDNFLSAEPSLAVKCYTWTGIMNTII